MNSTKKNFMPKIVKKVINFLETEGHKCYMYDTRKKQLDWCNEDICRSVINMERMEKMQEEQMKFGRELTEKGHTCVGYAESYPVQICWCGNEPCKINEDYVDGKKHRYHRIGRDEDEPCGKK